MDEVLKVIVEGIYDAIEEFFSALVVPSRRYTLDAFFVSLGFLAWSLIAFFYDLATFVDWQEAVTCVVLMTIIVLIDSTTRSGIKNGLLKVKSSASRFSYSGEEEEEFALEDVDSVQPSLPDQAVQPTQQFVQEEQEPQYEGIDTLYINQPSAYSQGVQSNNTNGNVGGERNGEQ